MLLLIYLLGCLIIGCFSLNIIRLTATVVENISSENKVIYNAITVIIDTYKTKKFNLFSYDHDTSKFLHTLYVVSTILGSWISILVLIFTTINQIYKS